MNDGANVYCYGAKGRAGRIEVTGTPPKTFSD